MYLDIRLMNIHNIQVDKHRIVCHPLLVYSSIVQYYRDRKNYTLL